MHLYAFHMNGNDEALLAELTSLRISKGWSQQDVGRALGASQGHLSKVLGQKAPISTRMRARIRSLLAGGDSDQPTEREFESDLVAALRSSSPFRALVRAGLEMHKYASGGSKRKSK
jgi:transcriptional regulator with XRE-family HTH domain